MGWDERQHRVSRAFSEWALIERDQRAFLRVGLRMARQKYDEYWDEAGREPGDPENEDQVGAFERKVDGLWPHDYEWMLAAAVLRDAVTSFEVYLEKASAEVLLRHSKAWAKDPHWWELRDFFQLLGVTIESTEIRAVRDLRHFLAHQRGELRTDTQRKKFAAEHEDLLPPISVELDEHRVLGKMDVLAKAVREIDTVAWEYAWGGKQLPDLVGR
jgi:hypothetical protein